MPRVKSVTKLDEECLDCHVDLVEIVEEWNPFPDDGGVDDFLVRFKRCGGCGYEFVTHNGNFYGNVPFVRYKNRGKEYSLS